MGNALQPKIYLAFLFALSLAVQNNAFQVTSPKLVFGPESEFKLQQPRGGQFDDYIITCRYNATNYRDLTTLIFKKKADSYEMLLLPDLQICSYDRNFVTTNGKWIFVSAYNYSTGVFGPSESFYAFYALDAEGNLILNTKWNDSDISYCDYAAFTGEDVLTGYFFSYTSRDDSIQEWRYLDGHWNRTLVQPLKGIDFYNVSLLTNTSVEGFANVLQYYTVEIPMMFSKRKSGLFMTSAFFDSKYFASYESFVEETLPYYNGNDTVLYLGGTVQEWSSGTVYVAEYQKNKTWKVVQEFHSEDLGLELEYFNQYFSWASTATWIDVAFLMAPNFPINFNETDWPYGGSVVMMYRDSTREWKFGGRISVDDDGTGEAVQLKYMARTKSDIVIVGEVGSELDYKKYLLYSYPLCFSQPINVTSCVQDVPVTSCNEAGFTQLLIDAFQYVDDNCGEPMASINNFEVSNDKAIVELNIERLGLQVGQCTATFVCPKRQVVSASDVNRVGNVFLVAMLVCNSILQFCFSMLSEQ